MRYSASWECFYTFEPLSHATFMLEPCFCVPNALDHAVPIWPGKFILTKWFLRDTWFCCRERGALGGGSWGQSHSCCIPTLLTPSKSLGTKAPVRFLSWQHFAHVIYHCWENYAYSLEYAPGRLHLLSPGLHPMYIFPLLILVSFLSL